MWARFVRGAAALVCEGLIFLRGRSFVSGVLRGCVSVLADNGESRAFRAGRVQKCLRIGAASAKLEGMLGRKKVLVAKNAKSVRSDDPLGAFKKNSRGEMGRYQVRGELWKSLKKLLLLAAALAAFYFARECWFAWDIFQ